MRVKNPFKWLRKRVQNLLDNTDDLVLNHLDDCIEFVNDLKRAVNSKVIKAVIQITPTNKDNGAVAGLSVVLDEVATVFNMIDKCRTEESQQLRLKCFVDELRTFHPDKQNLIYRQIATWLFRNKFKDQLPGHTIDTLVQAKYWEMVES